MFNGVSFIISPIRGLKYFFVMFFNSLFFLSIYLPISLPPFYRQYLLARICKTVKSYITYLMSSRSAVYYLREKKRREEAGAEKDSTPKGEERRSFGKESVEWTYARIVNVSNALFLLEMVLFSMLFRYIQFTHIRSNSSRAHFSFSSFLLTYHEIQLFPDLPHDEVYDVAHHPHITSHYT